MKVTAGVTFLSVRLSNLRSSPVVIRIGTMAPLPQCAGESQWAHVQGSRFQARAEASDRADWRTWGGARRRSDEAMASGATALPGRHARLNSRPLVRERRAT